MDTGVQAFAQLADKGDNHAITAADKGDHHAITAVTARLEAGDWHVRRTTVQALAQLADKGDHRAITAVTARLEHFLDVRAQRSWR